LNQFSPTVSDRPKEANPSSVLSLPDPGSLPHPRLANSQDPRSVLFVTLDSCRYDTFCDAATPNIKAIGPLHKAMAPGYFTYGSHAAMFVGFTPGIGERAESFINPKFGKIFKIAGAGFPGKNREHMTLAGRNIIDGFKLMGYLTIGSGSARWFDPDTGTGKHLTQDFDHHYYPGDTWSLAKQLDWLAQRLAEARQPVFAFLNVGETHVPYYYDGASWLREYNPCVPFGPNNDASECRRRQTACLEFVDSLLAPLLHSFASSTLLVCGDHGDAWGEDGLWEHGFHHPKVIEVPLLFRLPVLAGLAAA
jgi:hypothetical protein